MNMYRHVEMVEGNTVEPVSFVGIHPLRWDKGYPPDVGFVEAEEAELLRATHALCVPSLPPDLMEQWEKIVAVLCETRQDLTDFHAGHTSDCAMHNMPAFPNSPCDCNAILA